MGALKAAHTALARTAASVRKLRAGGEGKPSDTLLRKGPNGHRTSRHSASQQPRDLANLAHYQSPLLTPRSNRCGSDAEHTHTHPLQLRSAFKRDHAPSKGHLKPTAQAAAVDGRHQRTLQLGHAVEDLLAVVRQFRQLRSRLTVVLVA